MGAKQKYIFPALKYLLSFSVAGFLLYWVFSNMEWQEFREKFLLVEYRWVVFSMILSFSSYIARAYRWKLLINPFGHNLKTGNALVAVFIGYLANMALPRLGEVSRCLVLHKTDKIPVSLSIGTVITERVFDLIMLILLFGVTFLLEFDILTRFFAEVLDAFAIPLTLIYLLTGLLAVLFILLVLFRKRLHKRVSGFSIYTKAETFLKSIWAGFLSFRRIENKAGFIASTVIIWVVYFLMTYVITFSMDATRDLGVVAGMSMLVGAGVALSLPVQAGIGTYHAIVTLLLVFYGIEKGTGAFFATLLHTSQMVTILVTGTVSLLIFLILTGKNKKHDTDGREDHESVRPEKTSKGVAE